MGKAVFLISFFWFMNDDLSALDFWCKNEVNILSDLTHKLHYVFYEFNNKIHAD